MEEPAVSSALLRAAQYVRMSTEHQQYSTENQSAAIAQYAKNHDMEVVRSYIDAGKSGLSFAGREALQELIATVESGQAGFHCILVYDISRWGRFQDVDESAYYEYICKRAGIQVHYCTEPFQNDNSITSSLVKAMKRLMAGEYSRELSHKTFTGHCRLAELGFRQGSLAGYGLRRQLVDRNRHPRGLLASGDRKSLQSDRVVLVTGPPEEVAIVKEIYDRFVNLKQSEQAIVNWLRDSGVLSPSGRKWTRQRLHEVLINPKYIGANVYNRVSSRLKVARVQNPRDAWLWVDKAFEPIIPVEQFVRAQKLMQAHPRTHTRDEMLEGLRRLLDRKGALSGPLIDEAEDIPCRSTYSRRFGSLTRAFKLVGYTSLRDCSYASVKRCIREEYRREVSTLVRQLQAAGVRVVCDLKTNLLTINGEFTASLLLSRCRSRNRAFRWLVRLDSQALPDVIIVARMGAANRSIMDYYLLPCLDVMKASILLEPDNALTVDVYRVATLATFITSARRATIREAL